MDDQQKLYKLKDSLPKQFVVAMKTLFDLMDDQKRGLVKLSDIEQRWQDDDCNSLPQGFIESLQKVTSIDGLLTFDKFCTGLKICLKNNQIHKNITLDSDKNLTNSHYKSSRSSSAPVLEIETPISKTQWNSNNTAAIRPNNALSSKKVYSLNQLNTTIPVKTLIKQNYGPPPIDKNKCKFENSQIYLKQGASSHNTLLKTNPRGLADGISNNIDNKIIFSSCQKIFDSKCNNFRRHTLQNAFDYNMIKRLKQFEEEKNILFQGLTSIETTREWYIQQISNVNTKIKYLSCSDARPELYSEKHQEKLDLQRARVIELNGYLAAFIQSWERNEFPFHINLAINYKKQI